MITRLSVADMDRPTWLAQRRKSIGGSDAGAVLGLNPYWSAYALWGDKTGKAIPEDISDKESVRLGNDLEQYVADRWMERTGKKLKRVNSIFYNSDYPFAHAEPDRVVVGEKAGFEAKTTSSWDVIHKLEAGEIPESWYCQVMHYLMVTGWSVWYVGALAFGKGFFDFVVERNEDEIAALAAAEKDFWDHVTTETPPPVDGSEATADALQTIYAESNGTTVDLAPFSTNFDILRDCRKRKAEIEEIEEKVKAEIMSYMGAAEKGVAAEATVSWKNTVRETFDAKAFRRDHPAINYAPYCKQTNARTFRVTFKEVNE